MNTNKIYKSLREIPAQIDKNSDNIPRSKARYFNSGNAFMIGQSEIPDFVFEAEPKKAFSYFSFFLCTHIWPTSMRLSGHVAFDIGLLCSH